MAAEDYTGASPAAPAGTTSPYYLSFYTDALTANGVAFDVYDVDAHDRIAPDGLGVLGHYDAVVWYTGDDVVTRELGWGPGNASRLAMQELLEVRDFVNDGGRVLYTGQRAGQQYTTALGTQLYDPFENEQCSADPAVRARCLALSGSGNSQGDPIEYMFGAAVTTAGGGFDPETGDPFDVAGIDEPLAGLEPWGFNGADSAQNQAIDSSFIATGDFLAVTDPADSFPQFESWPAAEYLSGVAGPFDPHTGASFMWSNRADRAYKRLTRTITVPAGGATMSFWTSFNLELDFDFLIVEAHTVGQDDWTTLPDLNGHTSDSLEDDQSCSGGWSNPNDAANVLHPFLTHYQTFQPGGPCLNTGSSGEWNAANGSSSGWQQFAGRPVALREQPGGDLDHDVERLGPAAVPRRVHRRHRGLDRRGEHLVRGRRRPDGRLDGARRPAGRRGDRGPERQRLGPPRRPRHQGGSRDRDARHALHGLRPRGHHRRREAQRGDGAGDRLPPALTDPVRGGTGPVPPRAVNPPAGSRS